LSIKAKKQCDDKASLCLYFETSNPDITIKILDKIEAEKEAQSLIATELQRKRQRILVCFISRYLIN
jgi:hypothetical protein